MNPFVYILLYSNIVYNIFQFGFYPFFYLQIRKDECYNITRTMHVCACSAQIQ